MLDSSPKPLVAITGATGFIGKSLVRKLLKRNVRLRLLTRSANLMDGNVEYFHADLKKLSFEKAAQLLDGVDFVVHCGATMDEDNNIRAVNIEATKTLAIVAEKKKIKRFVFLSSVGVYGPGLEGVIYEEQMFNPVGAYEESKVIAEKMLLNESFAEDLKRVILRPSIVYGPGMPNNSLRELIQAIKKGYFVYVGKREAISNYIHVENVVDVIILLLFADQNQNRSYNISDHVTMKEFVTIVNSALGINKFYMRIPKIIIRFSYIFMNFFGIRILTAKRVELLTNRAIYSNDRLIEEYGYNNMLKIHDGISNFAKMCELDKSYEQE